MGRVVGQTKAGVDAKPPNRKASSLRRILIFVGLKIAEALAIAAVVIVVLAATAWSMCDNWSRWIPVVISWGGITIVVLGILATNWRLAGILARKQDDS